MTHQPYSPAHSCWTDPVRVLLADSMPMALLWLLFYNHSELFHPSIFSPQSWAQISLIFLATCFSDWPKRWKWLCLLDLTCCLIITIYVTIVPNVSSVWLWGPSGQKYYLTVPSWYYLFSWKDFNTHPQRRARKIRVTLPDPILTRWLSETYFSSLDLHHEGALQSHFRS